MTAKSNYEKVVGRIFYFVFVCSLPSVRRKTTYEHTSVSCTSVSVSIMYITTNSCSHYTANVIHQPNSVKLR